MNNHVSFHALHNKTDYCNEDKPGVSMRFVFAVPPLKIPHLLDRLDL